MTEPDITPRMADVLRALAKRVTPMTPNEIGRACGFHTGHPSGGPQSNHCGRVMGPAQRVIFSLNGLRERGLVGMTLRPDGLSGTAYALTAKGREFCKQWSLK